MVRYTLNVSHLPYFGAYAQLYEWIRPVFFFLFQHMGLIKISHLNPFLKFLVQGSVHIIIYSVPATVSQKSQFCHFGVYLHPSSMIPPVLWFFPSID